ncbi:MAG: hypothetical protein HQL66_10930 [Magnetococcales bacterium]|nr:hypothetical protein [Magnetococcales bacterium]
MPGALLGVGLTLVLATPVLAGPFCVVDFAGRRCWFQDAESCRRAAGARGSCVVNIAEIVAPVGAARYCVVESWQTQCIYRDEGSCRQAAERRRGECIVNPNDQPHHPMESGYPRDPEVGGRGADGFSSPVGGEATPVAPGVSDPAKTR